MANYIQIEFQFISAEQSDLLLAELTILGFEGFEEGEQRLKAFIPVNEFDEAALKELAVKNRVSFSQTTIEETNWNALWESNFEPVVVDDLVNGTPWVGLRADFHPPMQGVLHEIVITPKMSFGTGHHATTHMMIQQMQSIEFTGKKVFDFGTGTGVLAILAEKLGADRIIAIDNDEWSIENALENGIRNGCNRIELIKAGTAEMGDHFHIILANINKNVILENLAVLAFLLEPGGILVLSGLLVEDAATIVEAAEKCSLQLSRKTERNKWISLRFNH